MYTNAKCSLQYKFYSMKIFTDFLKCWLYNGISACQIYYIEACYLHVDTMFAT